MINELTSNAFMLGLAQITVFTSVKNSQKDAQAHTLKQESVVVGPAEAHFSLFAAKRHVDLVAVHVELWKLENRFDYI